MHDVNVHARRRIHAERLRPLGLGLEQRQRLLEIEIGGRKVLRQRRARAAVVLIAELQERAVAADAHADRQVAFRIAAELDDRVLDRLALVFDQVLEAGVFLLLVAAIELGKELQPVALAVRDLIEDLFHFGGEADVHVIGEVIAQQARDRERREARHERLALTGNVAAPLDRRHRRRVGRRPADAFFLEPLHERCFREARRRRGLVTLRFEVEQDQILVELVGRPHLIAHRELRQHGVLIGELRGRIVRAFDVGAQVTRELNRLAARVERRRTAVGGLAGDLHAGAQHLRVGHLRRHRALPDQFIDPELVALENFFERCRRAMEMRRTDGFVRFLRVADLRLVLALVVILGAVQFLHRRRGLRQRLRAERGRVGSVIRDHAFELAAAEVHALEQPLRDLHRPLGRKSELAVGFLLQRGRRERR